MAGGAAQLPKWQIVLADPIGWQEWLQPAKMAESGRKLPKWQPEQILCQMFCQIDIANIVPNKIIFFPIFFGLHLPILNVGYL